MKKVFLFFCLIFTFTSIYGADSETLIVLHTNDLHAHLMKSNRRAGFAKIAAFIKQTRKNNKHVIVLDAGDQITGTPVSSIFKGEPVYKIISLMGYTASTFGNHAFDYGWKQAEKLKSIATYPIITANAIAPDGKLIADAAYKIFNVNGIKVGVFGLISEKTPLKVMKDGIKGVKFLPEIETAKKMVAELKGKCDFIIALTHIGIKNDKKLAESVKGIDLIVGGHSHSVLRKPLKVNNTYIVQANCYGRYVGVVKAEIDMNNRKLESLTGYLVPPYKMPPPDPKVEKVISEWEAKVKDRVEKNIGKSSHTFKKSELKALFQKILKAKTGSDFGYYNNGGIRDKIYKGTITARNIWNIEPFGSTIVACTIKGKNLGGALLRRLRKNKVNILSEKDYTVATNSYVAASPNRFIGKPFKKNNTKMSVRESVIDYIRNYCRNDKSL